MYLWTVFATTCRLQTSHVYQAQQGPVGSDPQRGVRNACRGHAERATAQIRPGKGVDSRRASRPGHGRLLIRLRRITGRRFAGGEFESCPRSQTDSPRNCRRNRLTRRPETPRLGPLSYPPVIAPLARVERFPATLCFATTFPAAQAQQGHLPPVYACNLCETLRLSH